jgi:predicted enzyme related to lactoylglutathione lyase
VASVEERMLSGLSAPERQRLVRDPLPGVDLDALGRPGAGIALWLHAPDAQEIHDALADAGTTIVAEPFDGPFGRTFTFADPDGYQVTLHSDG